MKNDKIFETLEFGKILNEVKEYAQTAFAKDIILKLRPSTVMAEVQIWQNETEEALALIEQNCLIPIPRLNHLSEVIKRLEVGAVINGREIAEIGRLLSTANQVEAFFVSLAEDDKIYPALNLWVEQIILLPALVKLIQQSFSEEGSVLTSASSELARIRRKQGQTEQDIRNQLNQILRSQASRLSDNLITVRNNRYVLPVKAEYRQQFGGQVHDQSSTGQTLYIEPQPVVSLNNQLAMLAQDEQREIERILREISNSLMPYTNEISQNQVVMAQLDFIQAKGHYAQKIQASKPKLSAEQEIHLWQARHPLIPANQIVANDIHLGENYRALIITGPNTGGKTILLKTLGILQLMGQAGLHIPAEAGSQIGIFDYVFADIGDEQSIEQNLSTFSSHMTNIIRILSMVTKQSLALFDELGSGTDPQEGASLAMAILDYLRARGVSVMATTHYPELKLYANQTASTLNASMEFDVTTLSPTYRLLTGIPGRSNALEISKRLGLDPTIIAQARAGISQESRAVDQMVAELEEERKALEDEHRLSSRYLAEAEKLQADLQAEFQAWQANKERLTAQAIEEANQLVREKELQAEQLLNEIRELQLAQGQQQIIKEDQLIRKKSQFGDLKEAEQLKKNKVLKRVKRQQAYQVGDDVEVQSYGQRGNIIEKINDEEFIVQMGILKMKIPSAELAPLEKVENKRKVNVQRQANSKVATQLDIRGQRYEAALDELNQYLDKALLSKHPMVTIIHGKGTGALREGVQKTLNKHPQVKEFNYSPPNAGGDGSTVVIFK